MVLMKAKQQLSVFLLSGHHSSLLRVEFSWALSFSWLHSPSAFGRYSLSLLSHQVPPVSAKRNRFPQIFYSFSFHLLQIAPYCDGSQHIFLGEWERESGALMEFAHFQNILSSDNFPFESFWLIYKSASLMWTGSPFQYQLINWIFCSDTLWWWCVFFLFQLLYFQRVRRQCCLFWIIPVSRVYDWGNLNIQDHSFL